MTDVMRCTDCLHLVATADLGELPTAAAVAEHCRSCADCARLVDAIAEETRRLADTLDGTPPGVPSHVVALEAVAGASRHGRRGERWRVAAATVGVLGTLLASAALVLTRESPGPLEARTVELQCLGPEQAAELVRGSLPAPVSVSFHPSAHLPILTLRGRHRDLEMAQEVITRLDARWGAERSAYCASGPGAGRRSDQPAPGHDAPTR